MDICFHLIQVNTKEHKSISYGKSMLNFVRNCQNVFQIGCTILHSISNEFSFLLLLIFLAFGIVIVLDFYVVKMYSSISLLF